jgi:CheY-like chemotaxis protein
MSNVPAFGLPASSGLLGLFRACLTGRSHEFFESSQVPTDDVDEDPSHDDRAVRVLVVDDNPVNRMLMAALLKSRRLVPSLAADGAEAVALARERAFDLILMDLQMPILDGFGAAAAIRRFESNTSRSAVPVVAYSTATPGAGVLAKYGINGSLNKPCGEHELEDCLVQWCPTYRPVSTVRRATHHAGAWQPASRAFAGRNLSLR